MLNNPELGNIWSRKLLDVLIQAGLIAALVALCFRIFSPFLTLMLWAVILAVTLYPLHQIIVRKLGGRQGWAATVLVLCGILLIVVPTFLLASSLADSIVSFVQGMRDNTLVIPPPSDAVAGWPVVGEKLHAVWQLAATDLPALLQKLQPKIGDLARAALGYVAGMGGSMLAFLFSFIVAGIIMAYGEGGAESMRAIHRRIVGAERGDRFTALSTATIRAVAMGVLGVALIQAIVIGLALILAGIPYAGVLAVITLVLGVAQIPALLITLPAIAYIWMSGSYETTPAVIYTVLLVIAGFADNVLKPLLLGRGVDAPMPVILLGALGGMVSAGILGMFAGAVLLALGYQLFMAWVADTSEVEAASNAAPTDPAEPA
ncbi:MAG: AI-2E family transporter [Thiobacillus sp.]